MRYEAVFDCGDDCRCSEWLVVHWISKGVADVIAKCNSEAEALALASMYNKGCI